MALSRFDRKLAYVQAGSGLAFSTFSCLHLAGHLSANIRFSLADSALIAFREYYQHPFIEPFLIGVSLVAHIGSSVARVYIRRAAKAQRTSKKVVIEEKAQDGGAAAWPTMATALRELNWHRYTGYILTSFIGVHVWATRITPLKIFPDPSIVDMSWLTSTLRNVPFLFPPYYFALGTAGIYHTLYGVHRALCTLQLLPRSRRIEPGRWTAVMYVSAALMVSTIMAIAGVYETVPIPLAAKWEQLDKAIMGVYLKSL
ncbi:uncharacterized protein SPPG_01160 [Spizellomyces punctatus DAOM BR117]|uniref:Mitochondrial adapter protein MCP1 transmembrane domain-containing protein n=1 Tax=Spizellomyces punctatus (strain DAOM BR117) TaxID=645134 RepID=A0A0L0HS65_SPIPD|nr:uncharacterized protein SPPG_01160 [Spizellomyces punctatus DAOM BR117]KND03694.1 hypothetical protein SPPG_01160 [Spizellomyces punctatus DAOM BR117]|eukprot:XP_016611733.1 hypothetical protein SPPG_01160 [Spizellomyces punctatus DAOM BR117]